MLKFGKQTQYALVALFHLDRVAPGFRVSTRELSARYDIPEPHLGKVLQKLSRAGLLKAVKGVQGGYELERPLEELRLGELIQALEGSRRGFADGEGGEAHRILRLFSACYVQGLVREVEARALTHLYRMSLRELLRDVDHPEISSLPLEMSI